MRVRYSFSSRHTRTIDQHNRHKKPFPQIVRSLIEKADVIMQVLDARFIQETRNHELEALVKAENKPLVNIINKADLAEKSQIEKNLTKDLYPYVIFSTKEKIGRSGLKERIQIESKRLKLERKTQVAIIGYPNTGKSSLINVLAKRRVANRSQQAGFTKGIQKITFTKDIIILDTPGVIPDSEASKNLTGLKKHTLIGVSTYDQVKEPELVVVEIIRAHPSLLEHYYKIPADGDAEVLLEELGKKLNFKKKGNIIDINRTARFIIKDWQQGKIKLN